MRQEGTNWSDQDKNSKTYKIKVFRERKSIYLLSPILRPSINSRNCFRLSVVRHTVVRRNGGVTG